MKILIMSLNAFTQQKDIDALAGAKVDSLLKYKFIESQNRFMKQLLSDLDPDASAGAKHNGEYSGRTFLLLLFPQLGRPPSPFLDMYLVNIMSHDPEIF